MTLYLYTKDEPSVSNCYDQCAVAWPPLMTDRRPAVQMRSPLDWAPPRATTVDCR